MASAEKSGGARAWERGFGARGNLQTLPAGADSATCPSVGDLQSVPPPWTGGSVEAEAAAAPPAAGTRTSAEAPWPSRPRGVQSATFFGTRGCDTWVRAGRGGTATPPPCSWGRRRSPDAGSGPGDGGRIFVLILPLGQRLGSERFRDLPKVTQLRSAQPCPWGISAGSASRGEARTLLGEMG